MKRINRSAPPVAFVAFAASHTSNEWDDIHDHHQCGNLYHDIVLQLANDQHYLSGYTEKKLRLSDGVTHIDHFYRKGIPQYKKNTFDWYNYVVDEHDVAYGSDHKDKIVKSPADYTLLINPITEDAQRYFEYMANGQIIPRRGMNQADTERADYTIRIFNLSDSSLNEMRKAVMDSVESLQAGGLTADEIRNCMSDQPFASVVDYMLEIV